MNHWILFSKKNAITIYNPIDVYLINNEYSVFDHSRYDRTNIVYASGQSLLKGLHIAILAIDKVIREGFRDIKLYAFGTEKSLILKGMIKNMV